jgi:hypothetical protein
VVQQSQFPDSLVEGEVDHYVRLIRASSAAPTSAPELAEQLAAIG